MAGIVRCQSVDKERFFKGMDEFCRIIIEATARREAAAALEKENEEKKEKKADLEVEA